MQYRKNLILVFLLILWYCVLLERQVSAMTALEKIYYGNIAPHEYEVERSSEYDVTAKLVIRHEQKFLDIVRKYVCIQELTPEVLRTFISKIVVHEREKKHWQTSPQQIDIYFRYIGIFALPSMTDSTEETKQNERRTA